MAILDYLPDDPTGVEGRFSSLDAFVGVVLNVFLGTAGAVCVIAIILSGIKFITSGGDPKAADGARRALTYSVVAFLLAMGAFTLKSIILGALGAKGSFEGGIPGR